MGSNLNGVKMLHFPAFFAKQVIILSHLAFFWLRVFKASEINVREEEYPLTLPNTNLKVVVILMTSSLRLRRHHFALLTSKEILLDVLLIL